MNPSTDINKRSLPQSLRTRFTELYVDEMTEDSELRVLISSYLPDEAHPLKVRKGREGREEKAMYQTDNFLKTCTYPGNESNA